MTEYNPTAPEAAEIVINDITGELTVDGEPFPWKVISGMLQNGNVLGDDPYVRFHVPASQVTRTFADNTTLVYHGNEEPFVDPDVEE